MKDVRAQKSVFHVLSSNDLKIILQNDQNLSTDHFIGQIDMFHDIAHFL